MQTSQEIFQSTAPEVTRVERNKLSGDIAESIMALRKCAGLSQLDFAEQYNIPVGTIRDWEQGRRKCPPYVIELLKYKIEKESNE